ncbi:MAG: DUF4038 domain-containing protein [Gammaproteobacteria bacterium]|nr:DUF4038 domain-containing protein [Gammaproteobacteria bacterium]
MSNTNTLTTFAGSNNGYMFSLPADATTRTLRLYVGGVNSRSRITATVTDGSTAPYTTTIDTGPNNQASNDVVTITYRAGANNQALIVRHILLDDYGQNGSINIQAATLQEDNSGAALGGRTAPAPAAVNLTSEGTLDWAHWGFTGSASAGSPSINRPNEAYFSYLDWIIDTAADYGLYVSIRGLGQSLDNAVTCAFPSNDPETSNYSPMHLTPNQAHSFAAWLGNRWKDKPNLIFSGGQDKNAVRSELSPNPCVNAPDQRPYWRAQAEGWLQGVTGEVATYNQDHPAWDRIIMTWHPAGGGQSANSRAWFPDDRWLTLSQNQSWSFRDHYTSIASDWARIPARPTFFGESVYEGANRGNINATIPRNLRAAAWTSVLAGGFGFTYGAEGVYFFNGMGDSNWLDLVRNNEAGKQMGFLKNLILSRPPLDRRNGTGLVLSASLATGQTANTAIPAEHVQGGGSSSGNYAFIYFPRSDMSAAINLRPFSGSRVNAWWYNPRDGRVYNSAGTQDSRPFASYPVSALTQAFTPPPSNGNPNISDWVLVLDDTSQAFGAPGLIGADPGSDPTTDPGTDPGTDPSTDPGTDPGTDPSTDPGTDPGTDPSTDPETDPGTDPWYGSIHRPGNGSRYGSGTGRRRQ